MATADESREARLELLVSQYIDRLNSGERIEPEEILLSHPQLGPEVLNQLEAFIGCGVGSRPREPLGTLGDYTLRRQIGRGGMGVVYEAWEGSMDRRVALKVLPAAVAVDARAVARFIREAQAAGKLSHPNVVAVHAMGVKEQTPYYAMEYVEGETLAQIVARMRAGGPSARTAFGPSRDDIGFYAAVAGAFADVADGLQHAHSKGVVHRDVKPSNLILETFAARGPGGEGGAAGSGTGSSAKGAPAARLRILDFGLARLEGQESLSATGDVVGTPLYMSPEQARRRKVPVDHRTDVYSLGATLYEVLTLEPPFRGKDHEDTLSQIIGREPRPPRQLNPRAPRDLETVVLKCLRKEPGERYGTAEALGQDLRRFVRGDPIEARGETAWERSLRRLLRARRRIALVGVVGALIAAIGVLGLLRHEEMSRRRTAEYEDGIVRALVTLQFCGPGRGLSDLRAEAGHNFEVEGIGLQGQRVFLEEVRRTEAELARLRGLAPGRPEASYLRARALLLLARRDDALRELDSTSRLTPGFFPARMLSELVQARGSALRAGEGLGGDRLPAWAEAWREGYGALWDRRYAEAIEAFGEIVELADANREPYFGAAAEARLARGHAMARLRDVRALGDLGWVCARCGKFAELTLLEAEALHRLGHPEVADSLLERTHERADPSVKDRFCILAVQMYLRLGDLGRLDGWIPRLPGEPMRLRTGCWKAMAEGRYQAAVEAGRRALELDPEDPLNYDVLAGVFDLRDDAEQSRVIEEGLARHPYDPGLKNWKAFLCFRQGRYEESELLAREVIESEPWRFPARDTLGHSLFRQGRAREAIECFETLCAEHPDAVNNRGWAYFCLGRLGKAKDAFERDLELYPDTEWPLRLIGIIEERRGDPEGAIESIERATRGLPRTGRAFYHLAVLLDRVGRTAEAAPRFAEAQLYSPERGFIAYRLGELLRRLVASPLSEPVAAETIAALERALETSAAMGAGAVERTKSLLALALLRKEPPDPERALSLATEAVGGLKGRYSYFLATLAEAQCAAGDPVVAVRTLEEALRLPHATRAMADLLEGYRKVLPELPSCASVDWWRESAARGSLASSADGAPRLASSEVAVYRDALLHLEQGDLAEAAAGLLDVVEKLPGEPEPLLRLAQAARRSGDIPRALRFLESGLERFPQETALSGEWMLSWHEDPEATERVLAGAEGFEAGEAPPATPRGWDLEGLRWLLRELRTSGAVRINCGGSDFTDSKGRTWGTDRFFRGGWMREAFELDHLTIHWGASAKGGPWAPRTDCFKLHDDVAGTVDDYLYQTNRWFYPREWKAGYAIPLPPGSYRVLLHFAEDWYQAEGLRRFSVMSEGRDLTRDLDPFREHGFATAFTREGVVTVDDGLLEIELTSDRDYPVLAAIEVERVGG